MSVNEAHFRQQQDTTTTSTAAAAAAAASSTTAVENNNNNDEVQVLNEPPPILVRTESEERREGRRKRRRKLRRMVARARGLPSFLQLLTANYDISDDEEEPEHVVIKQEPESEKQVAVRVPKRIRIDVDAQLGLKASTTSAITADQMTSSDVLLHSSSMQRHHSTAGVTNPEHDEGWYEGVVSPLALPEDTAFLPPLQVWIRRHLEFFSATPEDAATLQAGRRPIPVGRVGIRCVFCANAWRARREGDEKPDLTTSSSGKQPGYSSRLMKPWSVGAVSYPANIAGLNSICSQKPSLHFEKNCPHIPDQERHALSTMLHSQDGRRSRGGIATSLYYVVSCKRIGVVDHPEGGLRFGRDLSLEPLPFDTIKHQIEVGEGRAMASSVEVQGSVGLGASVSRIAADEESERILAQAVAEEDDLSEYLCLAEDKSFLTDYMFLTLRQMALCHALPVDFSSRGKKTKSLRLGFAGFCCRHCKEANVPLSYNCRSFASAAANLVSAISNSFATHLQKCPSVPLSIKKALAAYKRIHARQMAQLQHGSQRKLILEIWGRLRAADKSEEEMQEIVDKLPKELVLVKPPPAMSAPISRSAAVVDGSEPGLRPDDFPVCKDPEIQAVVAKAEESWDPKDNDELILPCDRNLVSDFVFLTMRQLKGTVPFGQEGSKRFPRRAGVCCIHCDGQPQQVSPSGRSFPSAPDNFAPALNSGFYNHMQNCIYVPSEIKRALAATRKIHSSQCSSLKFGSQRKFFGRLFARLGDFEPAYQPVRQEDIADEPAARVRNTAAGEEPEDYAQFGFLHVPSSKSRPLFMCTECRMVPVQFRADGAVFYENPDRELMEQHRKHCGKGTFHLGYASSLLNRFLTTHCEGNLDVILSSSFQNLIRQAVGGNEELVQLFTRGVDAELRAGQATLDDSGADPPKALWRHVPSDIDNGCVMAAFESFAKEHSSLVDCASLHDCPTLVEYLQLISPPFATPEVPTIVGAGTLQEPIEIEKPSSDSEETSL